METRAIYQPLHPNIRHKLSKEYATFHDKILQYIAPTESLSFSRAVASPFLSTGLADVDVWSVEDRDCAPWQMRIFRPEPRVGERTPALLYFHGGGYVNGGLGSENGFLRFICQHVGIVVLSVNYRHAPEDPFPAAIDDCIASLRFVSQTLATELGIDPARLAIGGLSAGGQLAASTALHAAQCDEEVIRPCFQMLICPVLGNTATVEERWKESQYSAWLTPARMQWYRSKYLCSEKDAASLLASPLLAQLKTLAKSPPTFIAIAGCDLLAPEEMAFAARLQEAHVAVGKVLYAGATHSVLVLAGIHQQGKVVVKDACLALAKALGVQVEEHIITSAVGL